MRRILLILLLSFFITSIFLININIVSAQTFQEGLEKTAEQTGHKSIALSQKTPAEIIGQVIKTLLSIFGILLLMLLIYGGYIWMMARGNEQEVEKAKNIIKNAIIGLIIIFSAYAITFLMERALAPEVNIEGAPLSPGSIQELNDNATAG